jgi:hypothetical protein
VAVDFAESAAMVKDILSVDSGGGSGPAATEIRGDSPADPPPSSSEVAEPPDRMSDVPISPDLFPSPPSARPKKRFRRPK